MTGWGNAKAVVKNNDRRHSCNDIKKLDTWGEIEIQPWASLVKMLRIMDVTFAGASHASD